MQGEVRRSANERQTDRAPWAKETNANEMKGCAPLAGQHCSPNNGPRREPGPLVTRPAPLTDQVVERLPPCLGRAGRRPERPEVGVPLASTLQRDQGLANWLRELGRQPRRLVVEPDADFKRHSVHLFVLTRRANKTRVSLRARRVWPSRELVFIGSLRRAQHSPGPWGSFGR